MTLSSIQKLIKNDLLDLESQIKFRSKTNVELINELSETHYIWRRKKVKANCPIFIGTLYKKMIKK